MQLTGILLTYILDNLNQFWCDILVIYGVLRPSSALLPNNGHFLDTLDVLKYPPPIPENKPHTHTQ